MENRDLSTNDFEGVSYMDFDKSNPSLLDNLIDEEPIKCESEYVIMNNIEKIYEDEETDPFFECTENLNFNKKNIYVTDNSNDEEPIKCESEYVLVPIIEKIYEDEETDPFFECVENVKFIHNKIVNVIKIDNEFEALSNFCKNAKQAGLLGGGKPKKSQKKERKREKKHEESKLGHGVWKTITDRVNKYKHKKGAGHYTEIRTRHTADIT